MKGYQKLSAHLFYRALVAMGFLICTLSSYAELSFNTLSAPTTVTNGENITISLALFNSSITEPITDVGFVLHIQASPTPVTVPLFSSVSIPAADGFSFYYDSVNGIISGQGGTLPPRGSVNIIINATVACNAVVSFYIISGPATGTYLGTPVTTMLTPEIGMEILSAPLTLGTITITPPTACTSSSFAPLGSATVSFSYGVSPYTLSAVSTTGSSPTPVPGPSSPLTISGLIAGENYTFTITDHNLCTVTSGLMTIPGPTPSNIEIKDIITTGTTCNAPQETTGTLVVRFTGTSIDTFKATITGVTPGTVTQTVTAQPTPTPGLFEATFIGLPGGNYNVTVTDSYTDCATSSITSITVPLIAPLAIAEPLFTPPSCSNVSDATLTVAVSAGSGQYEVIATPTSGTPTVLQGSDQAPIVFTGLAAGTYTISVLDTGSILPFCTATFPYPIVIPGPTVNVNVNILFTNDPPCNGGFGSVVLSVTGGTGKYTATATTPGVEPISVTGTDTAPITIPNLVAEVLYTITVVDSNGCASGPLPTLFISAREPLIALPTITNETCAGFDNGSIMIGAYGGVPPYLYSIQGGAENSFVSTATFSPLAPGTYSAVIKDAAGCISAAMPAVVQAAVPIQISTIPQSPTCPGGSDGQITILASGGKPPYVYAKVTPTPPPLSFSDMNVIPNLTSGTYQVAVQDSLGCVAFSGIVTIAPAVTYYIGSVKITPITANGASNATITVNVNGGVPPYAYSLDGGTPQNSNVFTGVGPGSHMITVTDTRPCTLTYMTQNITNPSSLTAMTSTVAPLCYNQANGSLFILANGGVPPYIYSIDGGVTFSSSNEFTGLAAGPYKVVVMDALGAMFSTTATITQPTAVTITNVGVTNVSTTGGFNGTITITATGGVGNYVYSIDGGNTFIANNTFTGLTAGPYFIVVQDANGCIAQTSTVVGQPDPVTSNNMKVRATKNGKRLGKLLTFA